MKHLNVLMMVALAIALFVSCQKDSNSAGPLITSFVDGDQVTSYYDDATVEIDEVTMTDDNSQSAKVAYAMADDVTSSRSVVTTDNTDGSITKTVTYVNWTNPQGIGQHKKNGVIVINIAGGPLQNIFTRTATFQNFTFDGNAIEGTRLINKTFNNVYTVILTGGKVTFSDGTIYTRESTQIRSWVSGYDSPYNIWDDIWTIEGTANGINRAGNVYSHNIINPLMIKLDCRWIVSGTIDIVVGNESATVDYGDGSCDNNATLTCNGKSYDFKLR